MFVISRNYNLFNRSSISISIILCCLVLFSSSCSKNEGGIGKSYSPEVGYFHGIALYGDVDVRLHYGEDRVVVTGYACLDCIEIQVSSGTLIITNPALETIGVTIVDVYCDDIDLIVSSEEGTIELAEDFETPVSRLELIAENLGQIYSKHVLNLDKLTIDLRVSGSLNINHLEANRCDLNATGRSECVLSGVVIDHAVSMSGDSKYNMDISIPGWSVEDLLVADNVNVFAVEGFNKSWVHATERLAVYTNGDSKVYYRGNPPTIEADLTYGGELIQKNE